MTLISPSGTPLVPTRNYVEENRRLKEALMWYAKKAVEFKRYLELSEEDDPVAFANIETSVSELALDAGQKSRTALTDA